MPLQSGVDRGLPESGGRYAHEDHLPIADEVFSLPFPWEDYIILPGELRKYKIDGCLPYYKFQRCHFPPHAWTEACIQRQKEAGDALGKAVTNGEGSWDGLYLSCGNHCQKLLEAERSRSLEKTMQNLQVGGKPL